MNQLPNLYVPGFPKSGTTSICHALAQHPSVFTPLTVEPHYWADDMPFYAAREGLTNLPAFESLYRRATHSQQWRLDGSTLYMYSQTAVNAIVQHVPDAKFIVCLRAPEDIVLAWHMQMLNGGYETELDVEHAFELSTQRAQGLNVPSTCPDKRLLDYQNVAAVGTQLIRLINTVGGEQVHVVTMPAIKNNPAAVLEACWQFLSLPSEPNITLEKNNSAFAVRYPWIRRSIYHPSVKPLVTRALNNLPTQIGERARNVVRKLTYKKADRQPPSEAFKLSLHEFYSKERQLLRDCLSGVPGAPDVNDPLHKDLLGE